jgi:predicted unusual protein kinase regulating ubiquinone biosynthesis (AarF/ABC1/UbiB family)
VSEVGGNDRIDGIVRAERPVMNTPVRLGPAEPDAEALFTPVTDPGQPGILAPLPRRQFLEVRSAEVVPPRMRVVEFRLSRTTAARRGFVWLLIMGMFGAGLVWDRLRGRSSPSRRAVRLRRAFERAGGTFIKLGKTLAMRLDLLPWQYGEELSRMKDTMRPFPVEQAVAAIERATARPLGDTFESFDPEPMSSSSVACVYQARLRDGTQVVVKVRRPGVGELFTGDLKAFDWLVSTLEYLTWFRPGRTRGMGSELRDALIGELDFVQAARQQDWFRRAAKKSGKRFFTAPRVYFKLSNEEVLTQEFVAGMWLWELLAAVEENDRPTLTLAARLGIDPRRVARRLAWVNFWGWHENLFFLADPNPTSVIIGEGGTLAFIDFGSVDAINRTKRRALQQNMYYASRRDALNMARASLVLVEPLPPLDVLELTRELEGYNWDVIHGFESRSQARAWSDRTFARQWIGLFEAARRHDITIEFSVLRLLRVNVLSDTLVVRLDPEINVINAYRRFARFQARRVESRGCSRLIRQASRGIDDRAYLQIERLAGTAEGLLFHFRQMLVIPRANFSGLMGKWSFAAYVLIATAVQLAVLTAVAGAAVAVWVFIDAAQPPSAADAVRQALQLRTYQWLAFAIGVMNGRKLMFRMRDREL